MRLFIACALLVVSSFAQAQAGYPNKPIKLVYPYPASGTGDTALRLVAEMLGPELGGAVYVENRPGANGVVGTRYVAESPPDGYTLGMASQGTHAANLSLWKNPGYDPIKNFTYIGYFVALPWMLVAPAGQPFKTTNELVAYAQAHPGKLTMPYYSAPSRLLVHQLRNAGKVQIAEIPYKAPSQVITDLYGGLVQAAFLPMEIAMAQAAGGKLRVLGVASEKRLVGAPDIPALTEQLPGVAIASWMGIGAPAGLPPDIAAKLRGGLHRVVTGADFRSRMTKISAEAMAGTPQQMEQQVREELVLWARFVKEAGIEPE